MPIDIPLLLQAISEETPSGADFKYHPLAEKIKEARRQEENLAQGVWKREVKAADYTLVLKLSSEALSKYSKDLQVAAWMTEALANLHGLAGLREGLDLVRGLLETFWDTVYPEMDEDGDLDLRSMPLSWIGSQLSAPVRSAPILKGGYNWYSYRSSRTIPTEEQAQNDQTKLAARNEALEEGEVSPEDFEKAFEVTPLAALKSSHEEFTALTQHLETLNQLCGEKFGAQSPDFGPLRLTLEEVGGVVRVLYKKKEEIEGSEEIVESNETIIASEHYAAEDTVVAVAPASRRRRDPIAAEPASTDDAIERILAAARYLRKELPQNPAPYLITRALRWGELRAAQGSPEVLTAPPSELRIDLKRQLGEGSWDVFRDAVEEAAGLACGRAWLDLQRYAVQACRYSGCDLAANAIISSLTTLIADFPDLPQYLLADDTPAANSETIQWLADESITRPKTPSGIPQVVMPPQPVEEWRVAPVTPGSDTVNPEIRDAYELAMDAARSGRIEEAVEILTREIAQQDSGRARFLRRAQLAQVCLAAGHDAMGRPLLEDLSEEISRRSLADWETPEMISQPLSLLYRCLNGTSTNEEKERLYARICKLDPLRALRLAR